MSRVDKAYVGCLHILGGKLDLCYGSMGRSNCIERSGVKVATTLGWTSRAKSSDADLE